MIGTTSIGGVRSAPPAPRPRRQFADPLFRPGMAAFDPAIVKSRLRAPTLLERLAMMRQMRPSRLDVLA